MTFHVSEQRLRELLDVAPDEPVVPPPEIVAFCIIVGRRLLAWKQETLASIAGVALSTVERAERGETVSSDSLEKIGIALGHPAGALTAPRFARSPEEVRDEMDQWKHREVVSVAPFRTERQFRSAIAATSILLHAPNLPHEAASAVEVLVECLDFGSFVFSDLAPPGQRIPRRDYYAQVRHCIRSVQAHGLYVLAGQLEYAATPGGAVFLISITRKDEDPAAEKRKVVIVDTRRLANATQLPE